jgi:membrane associated rhomboid family serine protease
VVIIPINAERAVYGMPWFTLGTVALCTVSWLLSWNFDVFGPLGFVPGHTLGITVVLYAYAHAGILHLLGNMVFLWCMGINLETRWGTPVFALVYVLGAMVSALAYGALHGGSSVPLVGASGAIATLMGAFLVSLFKTRIRMWYLFFLMFRIRTGTFSVPAYVVLPLWFLSDLLGAYVEAHGMNAGVAYSAHVGGFVLGVILALALKLSGYEARLLEATGADIADSPEAWTKVAAEPGPAVQRFAVPASTGPSLPVASISDPVPSAQSAVQVPSKRPAATGPANPARCGGCGLVNMPGVADCRRCGHHL